jgi:hypothetical protein
MCKLRDLIAGVVSQCLVVVSLFCILLGDSCVATIKQGPLLFEREPQSSAPAMLKVTLPSDALPPNTILILPKVNRTTALGPQRPWKPTLLGSAFSDWPTRRPNRPYVLEACETTQDSNGVTLYFPLQHICDDLVGTLAGLFDEGVAALNTTREVSEHNIRCIISSFISGMRNLSDFDRDNFSLLNVPLVNRPDGMCAYIVPQLYNLMRNVYRARAPHAYEETPSLIFENQVATHFRKQGVTYKWLLGLVIAMLITGEKSEAQLKELCFKSPTEVQAYFLTHECIQLLPQAAQFLWLCFNENSSLDEVLCKWGSLPDNVMLKILSKLGGTAIYYTNAGKAIRVHIIPKS